MKRGFLWVLLLSVVGGGGVWSAHAATFNSTNFSINGNLGDSAAGGQSSTSYKLTSAAGESIAGTASSNSYKLGQGYVSTLENSIQSFVQPSGLAAYWSLDNAAPGVTAFDDSSNGNDGIYSAGTTSVAGKVGQAFSDTTTTQTVSAPHSASFPNGTVLSVSGWIKPNTVTGNREVISKWDSTGNDGTWAFEVIGGTALRFYLRTSSGDSGANYMTTNSATFSSGTWYHVAAVYDGSQTNANRVKLYVNGAPVASTVTGTLPTTLFASTAPVTIGDFLNANRKWSGALDEIKIYNRALSASDIKAEYDAGNAGIPAGISLSSITPGVSQISAFDTITQASSAGYTLAISQNNDLTSGGNTISPVSGSIGSPVSWSEGVTKGLGFTLYGTNATALPGTWNTGNSYAALPGSSTSFYTRTGYTAGSKDILNMRLRLDVASNQPTGNYTNQMTVTGTMTP